MTAALVGVLGYFCFGVLGFLTHRARLLSALALLVGTVSFSLWTPGFPLEYLGLGDWAIPWKGDLISAAFWGLSLFLHLILLLEEKGRPRRFYALLTLLFGTVLSLVLSQDLFNLYVSLELTSLIAFLLVGIEGKAAQTWASLKYLILTSSGMIFYLLGVGFVFAATGTLSLPALASASPGLALHLGVGLLLAGAAAKGGVFLYAQWLPTAHGYAPAAVSAVLSGLVVKMGIVAMVRIAGTFQAGEVLIILGLVTGFLGILHALFEPHLKVFLAYSTVSQLGYLLLGFGWGAWEGAIAYAIAHGLSKALLFLSAGRAEKEGKSHLIDRLAGRLSVATRLGLVIGALASAGVPPSVGYAAKAMISGVVPAWGKWALFAFSVGTAATLSRLLPLVLCGKKGERSFPALLLLVGSIVGGGVALLFLRRGISSDLLPTMAGILVGGATYPFLRRASLGIPKWRLDEALLGLFFSVLTLGLWFLTR